jgi:hypothetical protein
MHSHIVRGRQLLLDDLEFSPHAAEFGAQALLDRFLPLLKLLQDIQYKVLIFPFDTFIQ